MVPQVVSLSCYGDLVLHQWIIVVLAHISIGEVFCADEVFFLSVNGFGELFSW